MFSLLSFVFSCLTMACDGQARPAMARQGPPWPTMASHGQPCTAMVRHGQSCPAMAHGTHGEVCGEYPKDIKQGTRKKGGTGWTPEKLAPSYKLGGTQVPPHCSSGPTGWLYFVLNTSRARPSVFVNHEPHRMPTTSTPSLKTQPKVFTPFRIHFLHLPHSSAAVQRPPPTSR